MLNLKKVSVYRLLVFDDIPHSELGTTKFVCIFYLYCFNYLPLFCFNLVNCTIALLLLVYYRRTHPKLFGIELSNFNLRTFYVIIVNVSWIWDISNQKLRFAVRSLWCSLYFLYFLDCNGKEWRNAKLPNQMLCLIESDSSKSIIRVAWSTNRVFPAQNRRPYEGIGVVHSDLHTLGPILPLHCEFISRLSA